MIEHVNFNPMLGVVIKNLEELEKTFLVYLGCKDEVNYCNKTVNCSIQATLAMIDDLEVMRNHPAHAETLR